MPTYAGIANFGERDYERDVDVPAAWAGRVVQVEFGAVNFVAEVFVDGERLVEHVGGWNPFAVDVSRVARPGGRFHLKVHVKGPTLPPIVDEHGAVAWPIGGWKTQGGIADDVWLRAYGPVRVTDAFIQTSVARHELRVDYTVHNSTAAPQTITIAGEAARANASAIEHRFTSEPVMLAPGETKVVPVVSMWRDAALYLRDLVHEHADHEENRILPAIREVMPRVYEALAGEFATERLRQLAQLQPSGPFVLADLAAS